MDLAELNFDLCTDQELPHQIDLCREILTTVIRLKHAPARST